MKPILIAIVYLIQCYGHPPKTQIMLSSQREEGKQSLVLLCENKQYAWIKTSNGLVRLNKFNGKQWTLKREFIRNPMVDITCGVCYDNGQTYIGKSRGILFWDNYSVFRLSTENTGLPEDHIINLKIDPEEDLLIETKNFGWYLGFGQIIKVYKLKKIRHHPSK